MSQRDIRRMFGQGGGDSEKREVEKASRSLEKRKMTQKVYEKTKRKRSAQDEWVEIYPWVEFEDAEMFCGVCRQFPELCDKTSTIVKGITENYRKDTLKFHDKSEKHIMCMKRKSALDQPSETPMAKSIVKSVEKSSEKFEALFNTAYYIAKENEAFSKFPELLKLQSKNGVKVGENYRSDKACRQFCMSSSEVLKNEVIESLKSARFFSVLSDGSTDKGIREQELVFVRYVDEDGKVQTKLADVVQLEHGHAQGVKDGILQGLETVGVGTDILSKKLVGINTDGAAVNLGKKAGAVKLLMDTINENMEGEDNCESYMTVVHCVAHNLELAVCDAKKGCDYLDEFEGILKGIFKLYYYSPKRRRELYDIAVSLDKDLKHYGGIQQIRWVASQNRALKSLLENYQVTMIHLQEIAQGKDDNAMKAKGYLKAMTTERFLSFLHFMIDWTNLLSDVSVLFQEKTCLISDVARRVLELKEKFSHMKERRGKMFRKFQRESEDGIFRGESITQRVDRRHNDTRDLIKEDINDMLSSAEFFIEERFIKHIGGEPHSLFSIFDFKRWPDKGENEAQFRVYGEEELEQLLDRYCPTLITNEEKEAAIDEWLDLKLYVLRQPRGSVLEVYQAMIRSDDTGHLKNILLLVKIMLSISPTTAECERGFSQLNLIKTDKRTCLEYDSLASLLRIKIDGLSLQDYEPGPAIVHWRGYGPGTRHVHGHKIPAPRPRQPVARDETDSETD